MNKIVELRTIADVLKYMRGRKSFDRVLEQVNVLSLGDGICSAELKLKDEHVNSMGHLHTGLTTTLVDCVSGYALMTKIPGPHLSVDIHVSHFNVAKTGDDILIDGYVNKIGKTMAFLELQIRNKATGDLLAKGTHTKYIPNK